MITKEDAINKLKKAGYNVVDEDSVITIIISEKSSIKNTVKSVKELFLKIDYQASFGVKQHSGAVNESTGDADDIQSGDFEAEEADGSFEDDSDDNDEEISGSVTEESEEPAEENVEANIPAKKPAKKNGETSKSGGKKSSGAKKTSKTKNENNDDNEEFFDDEDEGLDDVSTIKLDDLDMDMMLNGDSVQFSLEDFGLY